MDDLSNNIISEHILIRNNVTTYLLVEHVHHRRRRAVLRDRVRFHRCGHVR